MLITYRKITMISAISLWLTACGGNGSSANNQTAPQKPSEAQTQPQEKIFQYDDSIQCEQGEIPVEDMRLNLAREGIDVICAQKGNDGRVYPSVCGAPTGNINVFVIYSSNIPDAEKLGFKPVAELRDYQDTACTN